MAIVNESVSSNQASSTLASYRTSKNSTTDLQSAPSFAQLLDFSLVKPVTPSTAEEMSDFDVKALTQSGKSPQEIADTFMKAGVTIYDIARATGSKVGELRNKAAELGMDYIDPFKDNPALASAMDKLSDNSGGFVRIGVDEKGRLHLQTAGSGGIFGWRNMDQIRMNDNSLPDLVQAADSGRLGLFRQGMLTQQEIDALIPFLPQAGDTSVKYTAGGYPSAWSLHAWNTGKVQMAYHAVKSLPDSSVVDQRA